MVFLALVLFLLWPFGALIFSFKNYSSAWTKNIIWAFVIFYGYNFVLFNETMDANRLKEKFEFFHYADLNFSGVINYFFLDNKQGVDIIQPIILYLTSLFTTDFQVLMAVLAGIMGYFYSRNICYLLDRTEGKVKSYNYMIVWVFLFVVAFWQINGFRFWASAHILFYALIPFLYEGSKRRFWLLPFIPLLHFAYLFPLVVFVGFLLVRNKPKLAYYAFIVTFFLGTISTEAIGNVLLQILPSNFEHKIAAYTSADYAEEVNAAQESMSALLRRLMFFFVNVYFLVLYTKYRAKINLDINLKQFFTFCLCIMAAGNFASIIPSGNRFLFVSALFSLSFLFFYIQRYPVEGRLKLVLQLGLPFLLLASLGYIRIGLNTINELVVIGNPIALFFVDSGKALIEWF